MIQYCLNFYEEDTFNIWDVRVVIFRLLPFSEAAKPLGELRLVAGSAALLSLPAAALEALDELVSNNPFLKSAHSASVRIYSMRMHLLGGGKEKGVGERENKCRGLSWQCLACLAHVNVNVANARTYTPNPRYKTKQNAVDLRTSLRM